MEANGFGGGVRGGNTTADVPRSSRVDDATPHRTHACATRGAADPVAQAPRPDVGTAPPVTAWGTSSAHLHPLRRRRPGCCWLQQLRCPGWHSPHIRVPWSRSFRSVVRTLNFFINYPLLLFQFLSYLLRFYSRNGNLRLSPSRFIYSLMQFDTMPSLYLIVLFIIIIVDCLPRRYSTSRKWNFLNETICFASGWT